jgi:hypothetical protein
VWLLGLGLVLALGAAAVLCQADEPKKDADTKGLTAEDKDKALEEIALAYQIADAGRKAGSPEALLGAAKLLSRLNGKEIGLVKLEGVKPVTVKPGDKKKLQTGEPIKEDGGKPTHFVDEIKKLKADARKLNNPRDELLADLIDKVPEEMPEGVKRRGSLGGPKWMGPFTLQATNLPGEGATKGFAFKFRGNQPARVLVRNKSRSKLFMQIFAGEDAEGNYYPGKDLRIRDGDGIPVVVEGLEGTSNLEWKWRPEVTWNFGVWVGNLSKEQAEFEIFKN